MPFLRSLHDTAPQADHNLPWPIDGLAYVIAFMGPLSGGPLIADGDWHNIPQCMVERQVHRSLDCEIPAASRKGCASDSSQHRRVWVGSRFVCYFDACTR